MATKKTLPVKKQIAEVAVIKSEKSNGRSRAAVFEDVCAELSAGESLDAACRKIPDAPHPANVLRWVEGDTAMAQEYAQARARGYSLLADRMMAVAAETHSMVTVHAQNPEGDYIFNTDGTPALKQVLVPLSADVMASKRLQVDTLKWQLSKMLPKVYGDKLIQEITGAGGGAIQIAAVNLRGLSESELKQMEALMLKAHSAAPEGGTE
jgi:hypothetical protein